MTWAEISGMIAVAVAIGGLVGWILPSPIQMQDRISTLEKDLAVLVNTVSILRDTVKELVAYVRGHDNGTSGRRTRL